MINLNDIMLDLMPKLIARLRFLTKNPDFNLWYQTGHIVEICQNLQEMTTEENEQYKFPLLALVTDYRERAGYSVEAFREHQPNFLIATNTQNTLKAAQRYEVNFKTVLYPIYQTFIEVLGESPYFLGYPDQATKHTKIDRMFLGKEGIYGNTGNTFNDYIDAIEIRDMRLEQKIDNDCKITQQWQL